MAAYYHGALLLQVYAYGKSAKDKETEMLSPDELARIERVLRRFDNIDRILRMKPPRRCPTDTRAPRGRQLHAIPRNLRALYAHIIAARRYINRFPALPYPRALSYHEQSARVENAMKQLEIRLRRIAGTSEMAQLEYHSDWRYRVLRPQRLKAKKSKLAKKADEEGFGLSHKYLDEPMEYSPWIIVPRT